MLHLVWYIIVGLIAGFVAKSLMHTHLTLPMASSAELREIVTLELLSHSAN
jgi:hypothetical protein